MRKKFVVDEEMVMNLPCGVAGSDGML